MGSRASRQSYQHTKSSELSQLVIRHGQVFKLGGYEANPLVNYLMRLGPIEGLILAKAIVIVGGAAIVWYNRHRVVFLANYVYAGIVCWNLAIAAY